MVTKAPKKTSKTASRKEAKSQKAAAKPLAEQLLAAGRETLGTLVTEGSKLQKKAKAAAGERIDAISNKANQQWDKLEGIFDERVAKALKRLGVPTMADIKALNKRLDALAAAAAQPAAAPRKKAGADAKAPAARPAKAAAAVAPAKKAAAPRKTAAAKKAAPAAGAAQTPVA